MAILNYLKKGLPVGLLILAFSASGWAGGMPEDSSENVEESTQEAKAAGNESQKEKAEVVPCQPVDEKPVKVEGWINREYRKKHRAIVNEFKAAKNTRASIKVFPMGETAKVVGVGRCVPAYIARHILEKAMEYTGGVESLVNQAFLPTHWVGIGTTQFDEPSQQIVNPDQVKALMNPELDDVEFHALYQKFSVQDETVQYFGRTTTNAKKVD